ncbi:MAG: hypothetical protein Q9226_005527 [Calogaya cf. arnoldii]
MNSSLAESFTSLTNATSLEVRIGYFALCFKQTGSGWTCGGDALTLTKQLHPDGDPVNLIWQGAEFKDTIMFYGLILATITLLVIVVCLLATIPGWHVEKDEDGGEMDVKPFPSMTVLFFATMISTFASALALLSIVWQHVASIAFITAMQNMTYGGVRGNVGVVGLVLGWTAVATMMFVSVGIGVIYQATKFLNRLTDD